MKIHLSPLRCALFVAGLCSAMLAVPLYAGAATAADHALYLKASALFQSKNYAGAERAADELAKAFPGSDWRFKAVFLKAQALIEQKQFARAAEIYAAEANRLLSAERKQALSAEILRVAEKLTARPNPDVPDAPPPDFAKAYSLYTKALSLELPRAFRDDIVFLKARAIAQTGNAGVAIQDFQAYLNEYDPTWTGPAGSGSPRLPMQIPPEAGKHVALARFGLAQAILQSGNHAAARMELEDLLKKITTPAELSLQAELGSPEGIQLPNDIRWLRLQSYFVTVPRPNEGQSSKLTDLSLAGGASSFRVLIPDELEQAADSCRAYLKAHPEGNRAVLAAWMLAEAYARQARTGEAITAYRDFFAAKGFRPSPAEPNPAAPAYADLKMRALFEVGQLLAARKDYGEAITTWQTYIKEYPNGPEWPASQNAIINAEFQLGLDALAGKDRELALRRLDGFLRAHPLDERAPRILYLFGAIHQADALEFEAAKANKEKVTASYRKAIEEWAKLAAKYPQSQEAQTALLKSGTIQEEKLGEFEKALKLYQKLEAGPSMAAARSAVQRLSAKSLALSTERTFRTNEKALVHLKTRNIERCDVRLYKIDLQAYFRKMHGIGGVEGLDVSLIQPDKSWEHKPAGFAKYKPLEEDLAIDFGGNEPGAYVVSVGDEDWESSVLVLRSDLEVVIKSSRREVLAFVQDMLTGKPAASADVLVSDGAAVIASGKTGADGVFQTPVESLKNLPAVRVFAVRAGHAAAFNLPLDGLGLSTGLTAKGYLYTDRPVYLPGENVAMRGILREVRDGAYAVPADAVFKVRFSDPQGRLLSEQTVKLTGFGTFDASLALPADSTPGSYVMSASQEHNGKETLHFQGSFEVRQFKLETVKLVLDFPRRVYFRGELIEATLTASHYWGEPLAGRSIRCTLPDGRSELLTTNADGKSTLRFDSTAMTPGSALSFAAYLDGENVSTNESLTLARLGFSIASKPSQPVVIAGEPFDLELATAGADGKPLAQDLRVAVLRVEQPKPSRILTLLPWTSAVREPDGELLVNETTARTDAASGKTRVALQLEKGGRYVIRTTGVDRFAQTISTETQVLVSDSEDSNKLRFFAPSSTLKVGQDTQVRLHCRMEKALALLTFEGESILRYQIVELHKDYNDIAVKVGHELFPNFRLAAAALDGRELRAASKEFSVERELKLQLKPVKESFLPGEEARVEITALDQTGQPVEAELSLALVNEALFAVYADPTAPILDFFQKDAHRHAGFKTGATCGFHYQGSTRAVAKVLSEESERLERDKSERTAMAGARGQLAARIASEDSPAPITPGIANGYGYAIRGAGKDGLNQEFSKVHDFKKGFGGRGDSDPAGNAGAPRQEVRGEGRWLPTVVTGPDGKATASLPMPESTTAWRLTARGCSVATLVGEATAQTLTRKDFFVELKTPAFLREGDEIRVVGRVHNLSKFSGPVALKLEVRDAKDQTRILATREKLVTVGANAGAEAVFEAVAVPNVLELSLVLSATAGPQHDSLAQSIPVTPWGLPYAVHAAGTAEADAAAVLKLPPGRPYTSAWMAITVGADIRTALLDMALRSARPNTALARLAAQMPISYGAHSADDLLACASALAYANSGNVAETYSSKLAERSRALVAGLITSQTKDGSWDSQVLGQFTTARVFWALTAARQAGLAVDKSALDAAAAFLLKQFESSGASDNDAKAIILHALSCDKRAEFANCNRLYRDRNSLGNATLAYLARTFFNLERKEIAAELLAILESKAKPGAGNFTPWESGYKSSWLNDTEETTALILLALAETKPSSALAVPASQYLLEAQGCFGGASTRARGVALAALAKWFGPGKALSTDLQIDVLVNGKVAGSIRSVAAQGLSLLEVPHDILKTDPAEKNLIEFKMRGRGRYSYAATLFGFSPDTKPTAQKITPGMDLMEHFHAPLQYRGRPIAAHSSSPVKNLENGQRVRVLATNHRGWDGDLRRYVLEIALPPGARLTEGSLQVGTHTMLGSEYTGSTLRIFFERWLQSVSFELTGYVPGKFRMLPPVIREIGNPGFMSVGPTPELTVLAAGERSPDPYQINDAERFQLGQSYFNDGDYANALENLGAVFKTNPKYNESELARMLLWIFTKPQFYDARKIVELFEILRERFPTLEIPFERILVVGKAYKDIGEHERSWLVYRAAIGASFNNDSSISAVLEDEGRFLGSVDFQLRLWRQYPDSAEVVSSYFALSQLLYQKAPKAHELPKEDNVQPDKVTLLKRTADMLVSFLELYPDDPLADDAGFSLCNCMLDLKDYPQVVALSSAFAKRYATSELAPAFHYMTALGLFWQKNYDQALISARVVADGESKDRDFARYILGQIYHAQSKPAEAIAWYSRVKELYPDASEAINYFEQKCISLEEVTVVKPGAAVELNLTYRNIKEAFVQVYRVDLMKLYLQQKNLSAITSVQLAGIRPEFEVSLTLGEGKDYLEKQRVLPLKLKEEAAYLVICRGDDLFTSGMVLITPLKIEVQQDAACGRVRANVLDTSKGGYRPEVHIKAIGSADATFRSGETDLRGLFIADNLHGKATVIARDGQSRYAFFRGDTWLGAPANTPATPAKSESSNPNGNPVDYNSNLLQQNGFIQELNWNKFDVQRRQNPQHGIQAQKAY